MCCAPSRTAGGCPPLRLRSCTVFRFAVRSRKDAFALYHASCVPHPVSYSVRLSPYARRFFRPPCHYSLRCPTHGACFTGYPACRFSLHSVIPLVLHRGGSENPSAPGKTDCRAAGVYFGGIDFELRCFNNEIRGKSADRARAEADSAPPPLPVLLPFSPHNRRALPAYPLSRPPFARPRADFVHLRKDPRRRRAHGTCGKQRANSAKHEEIYSFSAFFPLAKDEKIGYNISAEEYRYKSAVKDVSRPPMGERNDK